MRQEWDLGGEVIRRVFYGWFDYKARMFRLSLVPADSPIRPSLALETKHEAEEYAQRKRGTIIWDRPPLFTPESNA